jgi:hypothetical protein
VYSYLQLHGGRRHYFNVCIFNTVIVIINAPNVNDCRRLLQTLYTHVHVYMDVTYVYSIKDQIERPKLYIKSFVMRVTVHILKPRGPILHVTVT